MSVADAVGNQGEPEDLQEVGIHKQAVSPKSDTNLVPRIMEDGLEAVDRGVEVPLLMQSDKIETQVDPPRC